MEDYSWGTGKNFVKTEYKIRLNALIASRKGDPRPYLHISVYNIKFSGFLYSGVSGQL